jgi:hypothetical protein
VPRVLNIDPAYAPDPPAEFLKLYELKKSYPNASAYQGEVHFFTNAASLLKLFGGR